MRSAQQVISRTAGRVPPLAVDLVIAAASLASLLWGVAASQTGYGVVWSIWIWPAAVALCLPLVWRRRWPFAVWAVSAGLILVLSFLNADAINYNHCDEFALLVGTTTVAYLGTRIQFALAFAASVVGNMVVTLGPDRASGPLDTQFAKSMISLLVIVLAFCAGRLGARQRELAALMADRARDAEDAAAARATQAAAGERTRIARDMHDIVAHAVSLMVVQAEAGAAVVQTSPERAEKAFDSIADTGRDALSQLRRALGVLRDGDGLPLALVPQPSIASLPELVGSVQATGLGVRLRCEGASRPLPADTELAVYRLVQEALTNTVKHARATRAEVLLDWGRETLTVHVVDDGPGSGLESGLGPDPGAAAKPATSPAAAASAASVSAAARAGRGLIGIGERIAACGGKVAAGVGPDGSGFSVSATLPA